MPSQTFEPAREQRSQPIHRLLAVARGLRLDQLPDSLHHLIAAIFEVLQPLRRQRPHSTSIKSWQFFRTGTLSFSSIGSLISPARNALSLSKTSPSTSRSSLGTFRKCRSCPGY